MNYILLSDHAELGHKLGPELHIRDEQEVQQLSHEDPDVSLVDKGINKVESTSADRHIGVLKTVHDGVPVSLHCLDISAHHLGEGVECHVSETI